MKALRTTLNGPRGFTLVEMIGVLAVISLIIGLLLPRITEAVTNARVNSTAVGFQTLKSSSMLYFGKYGRFGGVGGTNLNLTSGPFENWDTLVLLPEGLTESPFNSKLGTSHKVRAVATVASTVDGTNAAYNLDGVTGNSTRTGTVILEAVLYGVDLEDARQLNLRLDGSQLGETAGTDGRDLKGRLKYDFGSNPSGDVYLYLAHK